jgi:hypothetical protein
MEVGSGGWLVDGRGGGAGDLGEHVDVGNGVVGQRAGGAVLRLCAFGGLVFIGEDELLGEVVADAAGAFRVGERGEEWCIVAAVDGVGVYEGALAGSVAVNRDGVRIGKGAGYSDIEVALLTEAGLIGPDTVIVTTAHPLQVIDDELPETEHDFSVDIIVTPDGIIRCGPPRRPIGIVAEHLSPEKIRAIPALTRFAR